MSHEIALANKFTPQQKAFVNYVASGMDKNDAAIKAGYAADSVAQEVWRLTQQPAIVAAVQIIVARDLALGSAVAKRVLIEFVADESLDKRLRVVCAKTLLDRAGHIAPKAVALAPGGETPLNEMSMVELRALADKLSGEIAGRAKDVTSAKAAPVKTQAFDDLI